MGDAVGGPLVVPFGEGAFLVRLGDRVDLALNRGVHRLARRLDARHAGDDRWRPVVPANASLLVAFDPDVIDPDDARADLELALGEAGLDDHEARPVRRHEIRVRYGGADGPDLDAAAERLGLSGDDVVDRHAAATYTVFMLGFAPGFPYLGILPPELELPRRATPRTRVAAGSVAIAGRQTGIYPSATPGGWHLIGRTDARLWDPVRQPPALFAPGDEVRFVPA